MRNTITLAFALLAGGCKKVDSVDRRGDTSVVPPVRATVPESTVSLTDSGPVRTVTCGVTPDTHLTGAGIGELKPGRAVAEVKKLCEVRSDGTRPGPEGQAERVIAAKLGGETVLATVVDDRIFRLDVRTPSFTTIDSLLCSLSA